MSDFDLPAIPETSDTIDDGSSDTLEIERESQKAPSRTPQSGGTWAHIKTALDQWDSYFNSLPPWTYVEEQYEALIKAGKEEGRLTTVLRQLCISDRYFLLTRVLRRPDASGPVVYKLSRMVEYAPDGYLDLWAREHYKTSLITFAGSIQEILKNPEITIGIFSFTKPIAKSFLKQIMRELEGNELLKSIFPDILYDEPKKKARSLGFSWSADFGITVKRKGNAKEATVEAHGLTDGQPTSRHFDLRIYNDVVTRDTVRTDGAIANTTDAWELSQNLSSGEGAREWYEGTIYHNRDTYAVIRDKKHAEPRIVPVTVDRTETGEPVMYSKGWVAGKRRSQGSYNFSCQMLLSPQKAGAMNFSEGWIRYWPAVKYDNMNIYILIDPAKSKKSSADFTAIAVVGLGPDRNKYVIDMWRDRLSLNERTDLLFHLHNYYGPLMVFYEEYGLQTDIEHIEYVMGERNYRFAIEKLGGQVAKFDRIMRLQPDLEQGRWYFPQTLRKTSSGGDSYDVIGDFVYKEFLEWPVPTHDDMLDILSRIYDVPQMWPDRNTVSTQWEVIDEPIFAEDEWTGKSKIRGWA